MAITSLYKNKGLKSEFMNQRGIFNVSKVRSIFDKVVYDDVYDIIDDEISCSNIGGRRGRNIRDHLFVLYAIVNDVMNGTAAPIDIQTIDIHKCFDEMWYSETLNDIYDAKVTDDKFAILAKLDEKAIVKIKTPCGETEMFELQKLIIQGGVFSPIKCTVQIDTLGRDCIKYNEGLYKYKDTINVPPLSLIDDVVAVTNSGTDTILMNAKINMKMESKKLRLSVDKCKHIHIAKKKTESLINLKVHNQKMKKSESCSYLGDRLSSDGTLDLTIEERRQKGVGLVTQITGMVNQLSFGNFYFKIAFMFRNCMYVNGILTNSEIWYNLSKKNQDILQAGDIMLVRKLLKGHSKTAKEAFYLETGLLEIKYIILKRKFMYLWHLLHTNSKELIKKVYDTQKLIPTKGDWVETVSKERYELNITESDEEIAKMSKDRFNTIVTKAIERKALKTLNDTANDPNRSKSRNLVKQRYGCEEYFHDKSFHKSEVELLFAMRTRMINVKKNFSSIYKDDIGCRLCKVHVECQEHLLKCHELKKHVEIPEDVKYEDIFKDTEKQLRMVKVYKKLLRKREVLIS